MASRANIKIPSHINVGKVYASRLGKLSAEQSKSASRIAQNLDRSAMTSPAMRRLSENATSMLGRVYKASGLNSGIESSLQRQQELVKQLQPRVVQPPRIETSNLETIMTGRAVREVHERKRDEASHELLIELTGLVHTLAKRSEEQQNNRRSGAPLAWVVSFAVIFTLALSFYTVPASPVLRALLSAIAILALAAICGRLRRFWKHR